MKAETVFWKVLNLKFKLRRKDLSHKTIIRYFLVTEQNRTEQNSYRYRNFFTNFLIQLQMSLVTKTFSWKTIYVNLSRKPFTKTFYEKFTKCGQNINISIYIFALFLKYLLLLSLCFCTVLTLVFCHFLCVL